MTMSGSLPIPSGEIDAAGRVDPPGGKPATSLFTDSTSPRARAAGLPADKSIRHAALIVR
jgi:hypothetical protein